MRLKLPVGVIGLAAAAIFGYHDVYKLQQQHVRLIQGQITEEHTRQQTQEAVANLVRQIEQYQKRLSPEPDPSWLVREVAPLGQKAGVQLTTISQEAPQALEQFTRFAVALDFTASYHQLGTFLDYLEHSGFFIQAEQVDVRPTEHEEQASIRLVLSTLYLPPALPGS